MEYQIISNVTTKLQLVIDHNMKLGEVRGLIAAMLDVPEGVVMTITYNGKLLSQDEEEWGTIVRAIDANLTSVPTIRKLFCSVTGRQKLEDMSTDAIRAVLGSKESKIAEEQRERQQAKAMEPLIENMVNNPEFVNNLMNADPTMQAMWKKNPQAKQEITNPETLKTLMMSQIDPDRRRDVGRSLDLQLAQFSAIPGAQQMLERQIASVFRDEENASYMAADSHVASEEHARPDPKKDANNEALPNPWQASHSQQPVPPSLPWQTQMPLNMNYSPFNMFNQGTNTWANNNNNYYLPRSHTITTPASTLPLSQQVNLPHQVATSAKNSNITTLTSSSSSCSNATNATVTANGNIHDNNNNNNTNVSDVNSYEKELKLLKEMGFENADSELLDILRRANGDVEVAIALIADQDNNTVNQEANSNLNGNNEQTITEATVAARKATSVYDNNENNTSKSENNSQSKELGDL